MYDFLWGSETFGHCLRSYPLEDRFHHILKGSVMDGAEVLIPITTVIAMAAVAITYFASRNRERMAMIEKGLTSEEIKAMYTRDVSRDPLSSLKWGILFVLAGAAIMFGNFLHRQFGVDDGVIVGMVCLFVGVGLVVFYSVASKKIDR